MAVDAPPAEPGTFLSTTHPRGASRGLVYARAFIRPLAACTLPVMIATLGAALQGFSVMPFLTWGFPGAVGLASLWTTFRLKTTLAEIHTREDRVALRTVWESLQPDHVLRWQPVYDLRRGQTTFSIAVGYTAYDLKDEDWPDLEALLATLQQVRHQSRNLTRFA